MCRVTAYVGVQSGTDGSPETASETPGQWGCTTPSQANSGGPAGGAEMATCAASHRRAGRTRPGQPCPTQCRTSRCDRPHGTGCLARSSPPTSAGWPRSQVHPCVQNSHSVTSGQRLLSFLFPPLFRICHPPSPLKERLLPFLLFGLLPAARLQLPHTTHIRSVSPGAVPPAAGANGGPRPLPGSTHRPQRLSQGGGGCPRGRPCAEVVFPRVPPVTSSRGGSQ